MGRRRLACGDATKIETIRAVMGGDKAALCFTSPPYGNQREYTAGIKDWDGLMRDVFANMSALMRSHTEIQSALHQRFLNISSAVSHEQDVHVHPSELIWRSNINFLSFMPNRCMYA